MKLPIENELEAHFIAEYSMTNKTACFVSFVNNHIDLSLNKYLQKYKKRIIYSNLQQQNSSSINCRFSCISFILSTTCVAGVLIPFYCGPRLVFSHLFKKCSLPKWVQHLMGTFLEKLKSGYIEMSVWNNAKWVQE